MCEVQRHGGSTARIASVRQPAVLAACAVLLAGCALAVAPPAPTTLDRRLAAMPTKGLDLSAPVTVRWSPQQIPFIEAQTDEDAAFALGLVHAHLRLGQMAVLRRLVQGRLSELVGPFATDIDVAIRAFDFGRASAQIYADMPKDSRTWLDRYVEGVNAYGERLRRQDLPHEFQLLSMKWEPWTAVDSITVGRASGIDINWTVLLPLLEIEDARLRARIFQRVVGVARSGQTTFEDGLGGAAIASRSGLARIANLSPLMARSGSNSFVVAPERTASGAPLIGNDPHLGMIVPNVWLVAGLRSPSYAMVGMMVPGTPVFGFGRTESLAWGGTNLRARTSQLVDVSEITASEFSTEEHRINRRFWFGRNRQTRRTRYGPVMSELAPLPTAESDTRFAVRWIGHTGSDEVTALLGAMRARNVSEFRNAMDDFAVPPQTFLVADTAGSIAGVVAAKVPARPADDPLRILASPQQSDDHWRDFYTARDLPFQLNPPWGYLASTNNRPSSDERNAFGGFFDQDERYRRMSALLAAERALTVERAMAIQMDTVSPLSRELRYRLGPRLRAIETRSPAEADAKALLLSWDGNYAVDSRGALFFEAFLTRFAPAVYRQLGRHSEFEVYERLQLLRTFLAEDVEALSEAQWRQALREGLRRAARAAASGETWGDVHTIRIEHVFANIPVIGRRYRGETIPISGSRETIFKTSHSLTDEPHTSFLGAQSRHVSDLSDPDRNYFVLLGGQDGWLGSPNFVDQARLWRAGRYIQVPLSPEGVSRAFPINMLLTAKD